VWALSRLLPREDLAVLSRRVRDPDAQVQREWDAALA
jgi:hypothetical protein